MPTYRALPPQPNLEQIKNQAKDLLSAHRSAAPDTVPRLRAFLSKLSAATDAEILAAKFALRDAQLVIAREYGFDNWDGLAQHVESLSEQGTADCVEGNAEEVETILKAVYVGDAETVEAILKQNPSLATTKLERDSQSEMARLTLLHRADPKAGSKRTPIPSATGRRRYCGRLALAISVLSNCCSKRASRWISGAAIGGTRRPL